MRQISDDPQFHDPDRFMHERFQDIQRHRIGPGDIQCAAAVGGGQKMDPGNHVIEVIFMNEFVKVILLAEDGPVIQFESAQNSQLRIMHSGFFDLPDIIGHFGKIHPGTIVFLIVKRGMFGKSEDGDPCFHSLAAVIVHSSRSMSAPHGMSMEVGPGATIEIIHFPVFSSV